MISFGALLLVIAAGMGVNLMLSWASKHYIYQGKGVSKSSSSSDSTAASQQLLKPSPRRTQVLSTPPIPASEPSTMILLGSLLAAFMESFGLIYLFNALRVQSLAEAVKVAWICWLFLSFPTTVLHFRYHHGPLLLREGARSDEDTLRIMGMQAARIICEAFVMASLIFLFRK